MSAVEPLVIPAIPGMSNFGAHINAAIEFVHTPLVPTQIFAAMPQAIALADAYALARPAYEGSTADIIAAHRVYAAYFAEGMREAFGRAIVGLSKTRFREDPLGAVHELGLGEINWPDAVAAGLVSCGAASRVTSLFYGEDGKGAGIYTVAGAMRLFNLNGVWFPGVHVLGTSNLGDVGAGPFMVKAHTTRVRKADDGMVVRATALDLEGKVVEVLDAMRAHGEDVGQGVIIQPLIDRGAEIMVSVRNTPYGTETMVKLGGELAEEPTTTVRVLGEIDPAALKERLSRLRGFPKKSLDALVSAIVGIRGVAAKNRAVGLVECNPVICSRERNEATPVDVRLFTEPVQPTVRDLMDQARFNRQMDGMLNPRTVVYVAPAEDESGGVRYFMAQNAIASEREGRQVVFLHHKKKEVSIKMDDGSVQTRPCYKTLDEIIKRVGRPDVVVVPLKPKETIALAGECSRHEIPVVLIGSGFGEVGRRGGQLKIHAQHVFRQGRIVGVGPNTVGVVNANAGFDGSFLIYGRLDRAPRLIGGGKIAVTTQGGGMLAEICSMLARWGTPISHGVAIGNSYGAKVHQVLRWNYGNDLTAEYYYIEGEPGAAFMDALRESTPLRGVVILRGGRHPRNRAAKSHTDSSGSSALTFERTARDAGAIVVRSSEVVPLVLDMLARGFAKRLAARILKARQAGRPEPGLQIVSQSGGDGVTSTDLVLEAGTLPLSVPSPEKMGALQDAVTDIIEVQENPIDAGPIGDLETILNILEGDENIGMEMVLFNKFFDEALIPSNVGDGRPNRYQDAIMVLTNDPFETVLTAVRKRGWVATHNKNVAIEAIAHIYEYARWLADNLARP
jgi:hypothetical protein